MENKLYKVNPDYASSPGATIMEIMSDAKMTLPELAGKLNISVQRLSKIIDGEIKINFMIAEELQKVFNVPIDFWMNLEKNFDQKNKSYISDENPINKMM